MVNFPELPFNKYKAYVSLVPIRNTGNPYLRLKFDLKLTVIKNISYTILYGVSGKKMFSPWFLSKDRFGGDTYFNEMTNRQGVVTPNVYDFNAYGRFIRNRESLYPEWFGYFDNYYQINKEWKQKGRDAVAGAAEWERILTPELSASIASKKFEKERL